MTGRDIARAIESVAPLSLQEQYDNSGWQLGQPDAPVTGVLLCVDMTPDVVAQAVSRHCSLVVSHHPLLFRGLKHITGATVVERAVIDALHAGISLYSAHTNLDNAPAPYGVSHRMAAMLGLNDVTVLAPNPLRPDAGAGVIGTLPTPLDPMQAASLAAGCFGAAVPRMTRPPHLDRPVSRVALCGGSGSSLLPDAVAAGADMMVTADLSYHTMLDFAPYILMVDCGHRETEDCTKQLIADIISEKFPNFAVQMATADINPVIPVPNL